MSTTPTRLTPLGLMIGPLNKWLRESAEPAIDCADAILDVLRDNGYEIRCTRCREHYLLCNCRAVVTPSRTDREPHPPLSEVSAHNRPVEESPGTSE